MDAEINKIPTRISNPDRDTINAAKLIAKKYKIPYQHLLQGRRPSGSLNQPVWDADGKIVPWKRYLDDSIKNKSKKEK